MLFLQQKDLQNLIPQKAVSRVLLCRSEVCLCMSCMQEMDKIIMFISLVLFFTHSFISRSVNYFPLSVEKWVPLSRCQEAWGMLHLFIIPHVQTQSNRVCNYHVILSWIMPRSEWSIWFQIFIVYAIWLCEMVSSVWNILLETV
jgi:hypothetical protein